MDRLNIASGTPWEPLRGYSRAVVIGDRLFISGSTAVTEKGDVVAANDPYEQTRYIISLIRKVLAAAEFKMADVVRTRMFVTNLMRWDDYARAHREAFENIRPASSIVQVTRLTDPRLLVEMEVDAIRGCTAVHDIKI